MSNIVFIADIVNNNIVFSDKSNNLEYLTETYYEEVYSALSQISPNVIHYTSLKEFLDNISLHKNDIVISLWSGNSNINRKVLVPSICEAYGIRYLGADPYVHFLCQDKALSKYVCSKYGINSAKGVLIKKESEIELINVLTFPLVVKPNYEGGSIGISQKSIVFSFEEAKAQIIFLLKTFRQPILVEEYIHGHEICITIAGTNNHIDVMEADEIIIENKNQYPIFGLEAKKNHTINKHRVPATNLLNDYQREIFSQLFFDLGKVDVMRIDGKIEDGQFKLIELSPDTNLSKSASTAYAFNLAGYEYTDMFIKLLSYV